jgi:hypothetical protein
LLPAATSECAAAVVVLCSTATRRRLWRYSACAGVAGSSRDAQTLRTI